MVKHPDISHHHPITDKNAFYSQCDFIITKATEGTGFVDSTLKSIVNNCESRKIPYWLYVFLKDGNEVAQCEKLVRTCKPLIGKYFVGYILDIESGNAESSCIKALNYIKKYSDKQMIYTMYSQRGKYSKLIANRGKTCAWWEARYGLNNGHDTHLLYPPHKGADLHQYTSNGKMKGIAGKIDLNRRTGTLSIKWFTHEAQIAKKAYVKRKYNKSLPRAQSYIKYGSRGTEVTYWQKFLIWRGYKITADGIFGKETKSATMQFQGNHKLKADGVVGPKTISIAKSCTK